MIAQSDVPASKGCDQGLQPTIGFGLPLVGKVACQQHEGRIGVVARMT